MPEPFSFGELDIEIVAQMEEARGAPDPETPFRIAILGDFSGRANRRISDNELADRKPLLVDRDNIDDVIKKLKVEIVLPLLGNEAPLSQITISSMDDFHPDSLFEGLEIFEALRDTRRTINDPVSFASLVKDIKGEKVSPDTVKDISPPLPPIGKGGINKGPSTGDLLDQVLEETETSPSASGGSRVMSEWDNFLRSIVQPHIVPDIEPQQSKMLDALDAATSEMMSMVLHHPDFHALEAAWRSIHFLVSRVETDENLKLYIIDISKEELAADLGKAADLRSTGMYKLLVEQTVETFGGEPWSVLAGNYYFDDQYDDVSLLGRLAKIAWASGAPFIAGASERILGCESLHETPGHEQWKQTEENRPWEALRKLTEVEYLGLALPRFLLRLPYGPDTDPVDSFEYDEMPYASVHNLYLWGNAAMACAYLIAEAFSRNEWNLRPGSIQDIEDLPLHLYKDKGETRTKPCAEVVFTEEAAEIILEKGIMPLLSFKNQDRVRLARFQSLADPPANLAGRWG
ncbi:MAG: type VI secretion system contractile sheath large subunit [Nitrospirota bacterium]